METPFLFVALDDLDKKEKETLDIAERLVAVDGPFGFKINLDYLLNPILSTKTVLFQMRQRFGRPIFADLKMWNGTRTMRSVIEMLVDSGVDYLNVYAQADDLLSGAIKAVEGSKTKILAVTVLTHYDEDYCQKWFRRSLRDTVRLGAEVALQRGCHGIILPGTVLDVVKDFGFEKWTPGVRLGWYPEDARHQQEVEPRVAVNGGVTGLVCGGPIMKSVEKVGIDNVEALKRVLTDMMG
jgi:orotidine-5'-phosphate decarboxylase